MAHRSTIIYFLRSAVPYQLLLWEKEKGDKTFDKDPVSKHVQIVQYLFHFVQI